jgi:hypothetical protein
MAVQKPVLNRDRQGADPAGIIPEQELLDPAAAGAAELSGGQG